MRILVLSPWWPTSAEDPHGSFIRDQALALAAAGHEVRVGVLRLARPSLRRAVLRAPRGRRERVARPSRHDGGLLVERAFGLWLPYRLGYDPLVRQWERMMARLVLRQGSWAKGCLVLVHSQDLAIPAHRLCTRVGIPYVVVAHGLEPDSPRYARPCRMRSYVRALAGARRVIAVGPSLACHLRQEAPTADIRVVLNGFDEALVARIESLPMSRPSEVRLVSVSNLTEGKGIHLTLDALASRRARGRSVPGYDVVGDGPSRAWLQAQSDRLTLSDRVRFHGALPRDVALGLVRGATAFVLPSAPEACGVAYLEAMGLGVAPVGILGEGPSAFIEADVSGLLVSRTVGAVGAALDRLLDEGGTAARLGCEARKRARDLGWDASVRGLCEVLPPPEVLQSSHEIPTWLSLFHEPTPYVVGKLNAIEGLGRVRLRRVWASVNASQSWGADAPYRDEDVLDRPMRTLGTAMDLLRGRYAGLHAGGWGGRRATAMLLLAAWLGRCPLIIESDTHVTGSRGVRAWARRAYLRFLDRRVRTWLPGGTPQSEHLRATVGPRAPVCIEGMTSDTATLLAEARHSEPGASVRFRRSLGVPADSPLILYVGRISPEKGVADLIEALAQLRREGIDAHLVLLGPGEVETVLGRPLPQGHVHSPGRVSWRSLATAYLAADTLVLPSRAEPWGLVVNEALLFGCPVVVTDAVGCARDLVGATGTGLVVPVGSPMAIAAAVRTILGAGGRCSTFAANALRTGRVWSTGRAARRVQAAMMPRRPPLQTRCPC